MINYSELNDDELVELLYIEEDRFDRKAVEEIINRAESIISLLSEIVTNQFNWTRESPEWWAVVHATYILGAIGTEPTVIPLLRALRWADAYDCDWVTESLPSIFGKIGFVAIEPLKAVAGDQTSGCFCRGMALDGLGMIAWHHPDRQKEIKRFIHSIFIDEKDDFDTRQSAGDVLLDLKCVEYKDDLLTFAKQEEVRKEQDRFYTAHFFVRDVDEAFKEDSIDMTERERDWLTFYDAKEIELRQSRWEKETEKERSDNQNTVLSKPKTGRNEMCPCGSGKKHKKCCLGMIEE